MLREANCDAGNTIVKLRLPTVILNRPPARPLFLHILSSLRILLWQSYTHKSYIPLFSNPSLLKMTGRLKQSFQTRYHVIFKKEGYQVYKDVPGSSCPVLNVSGILSKSFSLIRFTVCLYGQGEGVVGAVVIVVSTPLAWGQCVIWRKKPSEKLKIHPPPSRPPKLHPCFSPCRCPLWAPPPRLSPPYSPLSQLVSERCSCDTAPEPGHRSRVSSTQQ